MACREVCQASPMVGRLKQEVGMRKILGIGVLVFTGILLAVAISLILMADGYGFWYGMGMVGGIYAGAGVFVGLILLAHHLIEG